ncbi:hypothetical protein XJ18_01800 [Bacillus pumilus]|nr:hypothetical protein XJ18_01800 [Bacillus pumilus]
MKDISKLLLMSFFFLNLFIRRAAQPKRFKLMFSLTTSHDKIISWERMQRRYSLEYVGYVNFLN